MTTEKQLSLLQSYVCQTLDPRQLRELLGGIEHRTSVSLPINMDVVVVQTMSLFAAEDLRTIDIAHPLDWWQACKDRWAPAWVLQRWPVQYRRYHIDIKAIWQRYSPDPSTLKYGPFLPYVLERTTSDKDLES